MFVTCCKFKRYKPHDIPSRRVPCLRVERALVRVGSDVSWTVRLNRERSLRFPSSWLQYPPPFNCLAAELTVDAIAPFHGCGFGHGTET